MDRRVDDIYAPVEEGGGVLCFALGLPLQFLETPVDSGGDRVESVGS